MLSVIITYIFSGAGYYWGKKRMFQCDVCLKSYTMLKNLRRHQNVECGKEKNFKCFYCPRAYYYVSDLKLHVRTKHH